MYFLINRVNFYLVLFHQSFLVVNVGCWVYWVYSVECSSLYNYISRPSLYNNKYDVIKILTFLFYYFTFEFYTSKLGNHTLHRQTRKVISSLLKHITKEAKVEKFLIDPKKMIDGVNLYQECPLLLYGELRKDQNRKKVANVHLLTLVWKKEVQYFHRYRFLWQITNLLYF